MRVEGPVVKGVRRLRFAAEYGSMHLRNLDAHRYAAITGEEQELAARCRLEEGALLLREPKRTFHSRRFRRSMTAEHDDRAIGRDHAALIGAEQVLRVLRRHDE